MAVRLELEATRVRKQIELLNWNQLTQIVCGHRYRTEEYPSGNCGIGLRLAGNL